MKEGMIVLVIDDDKQIRRMLQLSLEAHGYIVKESACGEEGLRDVSSVRPDIVILDLGLPDMDGLSVLTKLREWSNVPVVILSVRNSEEDVVSLLDAGANDYVIKPFNMGELLARIRAAARSIMSDRKRVIKTGNVVIDTTRRIVSKDGIDLKLTPTEYSLIRLLAVNIDRVMTHTQIVKELWGMNVQPDPSYLRVYILQLRRKLEDDPANPKILITEPGVGYRMLSV